MKYLPLDELVNQVWCVNTVDCYVATKGEEYWCIPQPEQTLENLEIHSSIPDKIPGWPWAYENLVFDPWVLELWVCTTTPGDGDYPIINSPTSMFLTPTVLLS